MIVQMKGQGHISKKNVNDVFFMDNMCYAPASKLADKLILNL